jgi:lysine 6-dehydrogenase
MNITVLGAGLVGGPIARDLAAGGEFSVTSVDRDSRQLERLKSLYGIATICADLSDPETVRKVAGEADLVVSAVPGFLGFRTLKTIIEAGKNVVDIAFCPEDVMELNALAERNGVTAICDMGVAPGMSNLLAGNACHQLDNPIRLAIYVGGLPRKREGFFEYKAVFSPIDVMEEYTRPARVVENGVLVVKPPLTEIELLDFAGIGTLEAFNSDGLRSLIRTLQVPDRVEKTLRYPGHASKIKTISDAGFFSTIPLVINNQEISPLDFTAKVLFPQWKLEEGEEDLTVMRIVVENAKFRITWELYDVFDPVTRVHSMARTTGYAATMAVRMIFNGLFTKKGITVPEFLGSDAGCVQFMLDGLAQRGIHYHRKNEKL